jgi:hypothetical protein
MALLALASCQPAAASPGAGPSPSATKAAEQAPAGPAPNVPGVAVVELFTSEGCSSCPPAEGVFEHVVSDARLAARHVVPLAFHVDYWDDLGWRDRFSSARFTDRQKAYARAFGDSGLYTPEIVVNGDAHFVGSDAAAAERGVRGALARAAAVRVSARVRRLAPDRVAVHADLGGPAASLEGAHLVVAIVQHVAIVGVTAGENAGRTLRHTDVVRALADEPLGTRTGVEVVVPLPWTPLAGDAAAVALVQDVRGMTILGADAAELP